ncbi:MAG: glycosyltransferase family 39 protein [Desulfobacca sp.]|nr:glycosyltransferase family 39 protein [Desulfobacca sp.]
MSIDTQKSLGSSLSLLLLGLAIFLPTLGQLPLIRSEAMYALIPQEMLTSGRWLTPILNGAPYVDKPPMLYWLNLAAFKLLGVSDWAARLPTFGLALGELLATFLIGSFLFSRRVGWLAGVMLLTSIGFFILHEELLTDHLITLTLAWGIYFFLRWQQQPRPVYAVAFHLCLAIGLLSKGFIGLLFPLAIIGLFTILLADTRQWRIFWHPGGLILFLLLTLPWSIGMELQNPGFLYYHVVNEQIGRFLGQRVPLDIVGFSIPMFWLFVLIWLMPWTPFLPATLARLWPRQWFPLHPPNQGPALLIIWAGVVLGFFTLCSLRIEYYSLPALPPLALALGWRLEQFLATPRDRAMAASLALLPLMTRSMTALVPLFEQVCSDNRREFLGMFDLLRPIAHQIKYWLPALGLLSALLGWLRQPRLCLLALGTTALATLYFTLQCMVVLSPNLSDRLPGEHIRQHAGPTDLVIMESIEEFEYGASLRFYAQRPILMVKRNGVPRFGFPVPPEKNYLISPEQLKKLWTVHNRVYVLADDALPLDNFLADAPVALAVGGKHLFTNQPD